jgi:hypothetical protein
VRLLLDENVPKPLSETIKILLRSAHDVTHLVELDGWSGTQDLTLYEKVAKAGFEVILTNDAKQMKRRHEVEAIAQSGIHRIQYPQKHHGLDGVGLAIATVCAALPAVLRELSDADSQQLVTLKGIDPGRDRRYEFLDPRLAPPKFWPNSQEE